MRKRGRFGSLLCAIIAVAIALIGITTFAPSALAQQAQGGGGPSFAEQFDLFAEDSPDPNPQAASALVDAARQAQAPVGCPLGALFIHTPAGDPLFQAALAAARRGAVLRLLNDGGIDTGRFFVDSTVHGAVDAAFLHTGLDRDPPTLTTTSVPPKGSKVKAGDEITVTMIARDDAEPRHHQTGVKTIQLVADSEDGRFVASENYEPCADGPPPPQRRVVATYIVPDNSPPIVRLSALAEDHSGLMDTDAAEFFTGEVWKGTVKLERDGANICSAIKSETEFTIAVAGDGEVSGSGTLHHSSWTCEGGYTAPATRGTIKLGGKKRDGVFTIFLNDWNPKNAHMPRLPGGHWIVQVGQGSTGEGTFTFGTPDVVFRVKLECQTCGQATR